METVSCTIFESYIPVSTIPGRISVTKILSLSSSIVAALVNRLIAPFAAICMLPEMTERIALIDDTTQTRVSFCLRKRGSKSRNKLTVFFKTESSASIKSSDKSSMSKYGLSSFTCTVPAPRPTDCTQYKGKSSGMEATNFCKAARSPRSTAEYSTCAPEIFSSIHFLTVCNLLSVRATMWTTAPAFAHSKAVAAPILALYSLPSTKTEVWDGWPVLMSLKTYSTGFIPTPVMSTRLFLSSEFIRIKKFSSPKLKHGSSRCFSPGSFAVFSGAAPPPFRIFAGGLPRRLRRRNAFGLIQEYCTRKEFASLKGSPRFARRLIRIGFSE